MPDSSANGSNKDLDFIFLFAKSRAGLELELFPCCKGARSRRHAVDLLAEEKFRRRHRPHGRRRIGRQSGLDAGLVDIKVCAVTDVWSGLKFVIQVKNRPKAKPHLALGKRHAGSKRGIHSHAVHALAQPPRKYSGSGYELDRRGRDRAGWAVVRGRRFCARPLVRVGPRHSLAQVDQSSK
jgi:hypothetical protein